MKKLFILILILVGLSSCFKPPYETVKNHELETTMLMYNLPKDTVLISIKDNWLLVFNMEKELIVKTQTYNTNNTAPINILVTSITYMVIVILVIVVVEKSKY